MRRACLLALPLLIALAAGCAKPRARIHGKVTYQTKPLAGAMVSFMASDNQVYRATTAADGSYEVSGVPQGKVSVSVHAEPPRPLPRPEPGKGPDPFALKEQKGEDAAKADRRLPEAGMGKMSPGVELPEKYSDPKQSGLEKDVRAADVEWPLDLK